MTAEQTKSVDVIRSTLAGSKDDYVPVKAGDLVNLFAAAGVDGDLAKHAAMVARDGKDGPDTRMMLHRDRHLAEVMAKVTG